MRCLNRRSCGSSVSCTGTAQKIGLVTGMLSNLLHKDAGRVQDGVGLLSSILLRYAEVACCIQSIALILIKTWSPCVKKVEYWYSRAKVRGSKFDARGAIWSIFNIRGSNLERIICIKMLNNSILWITFRGDVRWVNFEPRASNLDSEGRDVRCTFFLLEILWANPEGKRLNDS